MWSKNKQDTISDTIIKNKDKNIRATFLKPTMSKCQVYYN